MTRDVIAQADARAMETALQRVNRDAEPRRRFGCAQLLDVAEQDDLAMQRIEIRDRRRETLSLVRQLGLWRSALVGIQQWRAMSRKAP